MRKKKPQRHAPAGFRSCRVTAWEVDTSFRVAHERGQRPYPEGRTSIHLWGTLDKPVRGVSDVRLYIRPEEKVDVMPGDPSLPANIGGFIRTKPWLDGVLALPGSDYSRLWAQVVGGAARYATLGMTEPYRQTSFIYYLSFSSASEQEREALDAALSGPTTGNEAENPMTQRQSPTQLKPQAE
jgi:hypothetical protein